MAPSPPAIISGPLHPTPISPSSSRLKSMTPKRGARRKTAIFDRRTLEQHKHAEHVETAAEALAISLNEVGRIHWPLMEKLTGHGPKHLQRELDSLVYRNPEGEWGDRRPLLKRRRTGEAQDRRRPLPASILLPTAATSKPSRKSSPSICCPATSAPASAPPGFRRAT